jgi:hypothetical protein
MAEWLEKMIETVNREYQELPEWKRTTGDETCRCSSDEDDEPVMNMQEPLSE